jgi:chorismate mutase/prephenate dehydratase
MAEADQEVLRGILRRARLARKVGELESSQPGSIPPAADRSSWADLEQEAGSDDLPLDAIRALLRSIHAATNSLERPSRVACVGPEGGFGQLAARQRFGPAAPVLAVESPEMALEHVQRRRADFAVFPFETSAEGPLQASVEALAQSELTLAAKIELVQNLSLMSRGGRAADITSVYVFAVDRVAAQKYLASLPGLTAIDTRSPLAACQLALDDATGAALVPEETGEQMGLVAVQSNVSDRTDVRVRYGVASARPTSRSGDDRTSILFGVDDQPGALFDVLRHFAERGINLKTIQSRPLPGEGWNYVFYVELTGHITDRSVVTALEEVKRQTKLLKVLGSYPSG